LFYVFIDADEDGVPAHYVDAIQVHRRSKSDLAYEVKYWPEYFDATECGPALSLGLCSPEGFSAGQNIQMPRNPWMDRSGALGNTQA